MKILMVAGHFNLGTDNIPTGGVQRHISKVTDILLDRGYNISWSYLRNSRNAIKSFRPDIIVAHDFFSFVRSSNIPQITIFHGYEGNIPPLKNIIDIRLEVEKLSSATMCVGDYLKIWYRHNPTKVIYGGTTDTGNISPPKKNKILYLGRLDPDQSPELVFDALTKNPHKKDYTIEVCGSGSMESKFIKIAKNSRLNINFNGFITNTDEYIKNSDIVICSGYLTILESYINKRPVISPYSNKLKRDYLKYIPSPPYMYNTPKEIYDKINSLMVKENTDDINNNYNYAKLNSWENVCNIYEELFKKCVK